MAARHPEKPLTNSICYVNNHNPTTLYLWSSFIGHECYCALDLLVYTSMYLCFDTHTYKQLACYKFRSRPPVPFPASWIPRLTCMGKLAHLLDNCSVLIKFLVEIKLQLLLQTPYIDCCIKVIRWGSLFTKCLYLTQNNDIDILVKEHYFDTKNTVLAEHIIF
jgi:hypothetical protein